MTAWLLHLFIRGPVPHHLQEERRQAVLQVQPLHQAPGITVVHQARRFTPADLVHHSVTELDQGEPFIVCHCFIFNKAHSIIQQKRFTSDVKRSIDITVEQCSHIYNNQFQWENLFLLYFVISLRIPCKIVCCLINRYVVSE